MTPESQIPMKPRDYLILFSLSAGERHGYGIVKDVEAQSGGQVRLDPANLYRAVRRLVRDGLVRETDAAEDTGADERRRYFAITGLGREVLRLEAARLAALADAARARQLIPGPGEPA